jgi:hypothetical protein
MHDRKKGTGHRITADKREIKDFPKLPSATSFIRNTLCKTLKLFLKAGAKRNKR